MTRTGLTAYRFQHVGLQWTKYRSTHLAGPILRYRNLSSASAYGTRNNLIPLHSGQRPSRPLEAYRSCDRVHASSTLPLKTLSKSFAATPSLESCSTPRDGILSFLPTSVIPYAELIRLDKPAGTVYLFFPCLFSTLLAATYLPVTPPATTLFSLTALFLSGAFIMRGAGCIINDLWDRDLDPHVSRTRLRPIARGAIRPRNALIFAAGQCLFGLSALLQFPTACLYYGVPSLVLVGTYPLAKRITNYPQVVLGLAFSWGAVMGFPALGVDLMTDLVAAKAAALLYTSCVAWTVLYDMIYAHMDIRDDEKVGIKSIARRHEKETKTVLSALAAVQVGLLTASGLIAGTGPTFLLGGCGAAAITLWIMIRRVDLKSPSDCWWWFRNGAWLTGGAITGGLVGELLTGNGTKDE